MPTKIRKVVISAFGDASNVNVVDAEINDPAPTEVQVKVIYSGFAGSDINMRLGVYPMQKKAPLTPGYCFVGKVHANGQSSSKFQKDELVAAMTVYDSEAELINVPEKYLHRVPDGVDLRQATASVLDWNTAYSMVHRAANVTAGQRVFVHGMSGAVGYATMTLCKLQGATVYGTASERNHAAIKELGATPFVYSNKEWMGEMQKLGGAHVVFDPLGFESWDESYSILSSSEKSILIGYGGNLASLAGDASRSVIVPTAKLLAHNAKVWSKKRTKFYYITRDDKDFGNDLQTLFGLIKDGKTNPPIKNVYKFENIQDGHRNWTTSTGMGSSVVQISGAS